MRITLESCGELFIFLKELEKINKSWPAYVIKALSYDPIEVMGWLPNAKPLLDLAKRDRAKNLKWLNNSMNFITDRVRESEGIFPPETSEQL